MWNLKCFKFICQMAFRINGTVCIGASLKSTRLYIGFLLLGYFKLKLYTIPLVVKYACE